MIKQITFALISIAVISCNQSDSSKNEITKADLNGFYEQQGEGEIIELNDSLVTSYYSSSFNCFPDWKMSRASFNTQTPTVQVIDENTFTNQEGYTIFTYKKLPSKPSLCKELTDEQINSNTYNFETLWNTYKDQYAFFKEREIDWDALKDQYQAQFTDETPPFEFYLLLEKMVLELHDEHSDFEVPEAFEEQWDQLNQDLDSLNYKSLAKDKILAKYVKQVKKYNGGQIAWGLLNEEVAYIQFNGMDGLANYNPRNANHYWEMAEASEDYFADLIQGTHYIADQIINEIGDSKSCIIDLRFNGGGYDLVGLAFMSHFIDQKYDVFKKKKRFRNGFAGEQTISTGPSKNPYLKPVYVLTSPYTVSAAETTIIATMNFPNFERIGSNTNGALSDVLVKQLPNGWEYYLSNEVYESMDGQVYEVTGIPPNHPIDYPRAEDAFFKALYLELDQEDRAIEKAKLVIN